jgi:hypothetical protein
MRAMKYLALLAIGFWAAVLWLRADAISPDTPVTVLVAEPAVVSLPQAPTEARIVAELRATLSAVAAADADPTVAEALRRTAADDAMLLAVAASPVEMFASGAAVATATPIYDIAVESDRITIVVTTVELIPGYGATAVSHDHEDGHALINATVARRCGATVVTAAIRAGHRGVNLTAAISNGLVAAGAPVHDEYHVLAQNAGYGHHRRWAEQALENVAGCG